MTHDQQEYEARIKRALEGLWREHQRLAVALGVKPERLAVALCVDEHGHRVVDTLETEEKGC